MTRERECSCLMRWCTVGGGIRQNRNMKVEGVKRNKDVIEEFFKVSFKVNWKLTGARRSTWYRRNYREKFCGEAQGRGYMEMKLREGSRVTRCWEKIKERILSGRRMSKQEGKRTEFSKEDVRDKVAKMVDRTKMTRLQIKE